MIKVYSTSTCAYCVQVKRFLKMKNKDFEEINLDNNPSLRQELIAKTGAMTVPITTNGEKYVVGFKPAELAEL